MLKSELIQLLAIADERNMSEAVEWLLRAMAPGAFATSVTPMPPVGAIGTEGQYLYDSAVLQTYARERQKIQWIKEFRERTKFGLLESKEEYERRFDGSDKPRKPIVRKDYGSYYAYTYAS